MNLVVIEKFFSKIGDIINKFENYNNENFYTILSNTSNLYKFYIIILIIFLFFIFNHIKIKLNHIFVLIISIIISIYLLYNNNNTKTIILQHNTLKLKFLNNIMFSDNMFYNVNNNNDISLFYNDDKKSFLSLNNDIVDFYYNLKDLTFYNTTNYRLSLLNVNNLIKLELESNTNINNTYQQYLLAETEYKDALNAFHSMIYSLPSGNELNIVFNKSLKTLNKLLYTILSNISKNTINYNKNKFNIHTTPVSIIKNENIITANDINSKNFSFNYNFF